MPNIMMSHFSLAQGIYWTFSQDAPTLYITRESPSNPLHLFDLLDD